MGLLLSRVNTYNTHYTHCQPGGCLARLNITVPEELHQKVERWRDRLNISRVCQQAIAREIAKLEQLPDEVRSMSEALERLGRQKAAVERACFRKGVYDGLEWARSADYEPLKQWGERGGDAVIEEAVRGPAAQAASEHREDASWEARSYAEGWLAGVRQFWERAKRSL